VNVGIVSAATATGSVVINLTNQSEGLTVLGGSYNDSLTGGAWADLLSGGGGNDVIIDFVGVDTVDGGAGTDALMLQGTSLALNSATNDQLINLETVSGAFATRSVIINLSNQLEAFNIVGSYYGDALTGGFGSDTISGGLGNDVIYGRQGNDTLNGNGGADIFIFNTMLGTTNIDRIVGFSALDDRIYLDRTILSGMTTTGVLATGAYNTVASQSDDRIIFNTVTGALSFDADGSGTSAAVQFATLSGGWIGTLSAANFVLI
jgi:Ca2+-binding RTX toxin-like protein